MDEGFKGCRKVAVGCSNQVANTRKFLLKSVMKRKSTQDSFLPTDNDLSRSSSSESLPRLLKYCRDKSGSKSFENEEAEFKSSSINIGSDEEYFSCDNTGASSPSQLKRDVVASSEKLCDNSSPNIFRSWSFQNITEFKRNFDRRRDARSHSPLQSLRAEYKIALRPTATNNLCDHVKENRPEQTGEMTGQMEKGYDALKVICDNLKKPMGEKTSEDDFKGYIDEKTEDFADDYFFQIKRPKTKCSLERIDISHNFHLNEVKVDQNFKVMTKMLINLADEVEGKVSPSKRKSIKGKRKSKYKKRNDRTVTWDQGHQNEFFETEGKLKSPGKERKVSACVQNPSEALNSLGDSSKPREDSLLNFLSQTDEIKEDPMEGEGEGCSQTILNLNLCPSEELEVEKKENEICTYSGASNLDSFSENLVMKPQRSQGSKKKRKKRLRRGTAISSKDYNPSTFLKEMETLKGFSPLSKLEKQKSKISEGGFSDLSNSSPMGKYSLNSSERKVFSFKNPRKKSVAKPKDQILKMISSLNEIEKNL